MVHTARKKIIAITITLAVLVAQGISWAGPGKVIVEGGTGNGVSGPLVISQGSIGISPSPSLLLVEPGTILLPDHFAASFPSNPDNGNGNVVIPKTTALGERLMALVEPFATRRPEEAIFALNSLLHQNPNGDPELKANKDAADLFLKLVSNPAFARLELNPARRDFWPELAEALGERTLEALVLISHLWHKDPRAQTLLAGILKARNVANTAASLKMDLENTLGRMNALFDGAGEKAKLNSTQSPRIGVPTEWGTGRHTPMLLAVSDDGPEMAKGVQEPASPKIASPRSHRVPPGVKHALLNSAVIVIGVPIGALILYFHMARQLEPMPQPGILLRFFLPFAIFFLNYLLVIAFWTMRFYLYLKLSTTGKRLFLTVFSALQALWIASATGLFWISATFEWPLEWPLLLAVGRGLLTLFALLGFIHHFLYRLDSPSVIGKSWWDFLSRIWGNIRQQIYYDSLKSRGAKNELVRLRDKKIHKP